MAIQLPKGLPAAAALRAEGLEIIEGSGAGSRGEGRKSPKPLKIALLNLMPAKAETELQFARLLGAGPRPVALTLLLPDGYQPRTVRKSHIERFYQRWSAVADQSFDGLIVTGAPVERLAFEDVTYWPELTRIFDWARQKVARSLNICWAGQAALYHRHGVAKHSLPEKMFGLFQHSLTRPGHSLTRGLEGGLPVPVSRHSEVRRAAVESVPGLEVLAESAEAGLCLVADPAARAAYMFNHLEYDADTLGREYRRDLRSGRPVPLPRHYFPGDDPAREPFDRWRGHAHLFFRNWLDEIHQAVGGGSKRQLALDWLFTRPRLTVAAGAPVADLLLERRGEADSLPEILRALEAISARPAVVRNPAPKSEERSLLLRFTGTDCGAAVQIARHLLRLPGIARISYRIGEREGGVLRGYDALPAARSLASEPGNRGLAA